MNKGTSVKETYGPVIFACLIWLLAFQNPLQVKWGLFSYVDELTALLGVALFGYETVVVRKFQNLKEIRFLLAALGIFTAVGLLGNVLYRFQPLGSVVIDLYTNLKFFFAIGTGYYLLRDVSWEALKKQGNIHGRLIVLLLFCVFLYDQKVKFAADDYRNGIRVAWLFYEHPTYLAGSMAFLMMLLTVFFEKKNIPFLAMAAIMLAMTMRGKAIASAAVYLALFVFFIVCKQELKLWHVAVLAVLCLVTAWPQIHMYYIEMAGTSTRSVLTKLSLQIMGDYFPIGTGFATFGSAEASEHFSPVYVLYNLEGQVGDATWRDYLCDTFWPILLAQTGAIGTAVYTAALGWVAKPCLQIRKQNLYAYTGVLFAIIYLLISSTSEPAFHNAIAIPLAVLAGTAMDKWQKPV